MKAGSDDIRERIIALADQCVMCGLCLPQCPTYGLDGHESESPRGRIALARALAAGEWVADDDSRLALDHCLGCMRCERVCPSGVRYGELLVATRSLLGPSPQRPRRLLSLLTRPRLLAPLTAMARALRLPSRLGRWPESGRAGLRAALALLRHPPSRTSTFPATTTMASTRGRVALFGGCVTISEDAAATEALRRLLEAAGFAVEVWSAFCCGALDRHDGETARAVTAASHVRTHWHDGLDALLTVTPGCLDTLRHALPDARVDDALAFLGEHAEALRFRPLPARVALHLPCTQVNVAHSEDALRRLLARVPELEVTELPATPACCGAAGSHLLQFPQRAAVLRRVKQTQTRTLAAQRLLSSNIGCRLHLAVDAGPDWPPDEHPLTLLARQLEVS